MTLREEVRAALVVALVASLAAAPARALISLNDGHDRIYVSAALSAARDSNIFANSDDRSDYVYSSLLRAEYARRAGLIGITANASLSSSRFSANHEQDFDNPAFSLELTKATGRTTGSFTASASRESRADADVNTRSTSWEIPVGLTFKYPLIATYTLAGNFGYSSRDYTDETAFASLTSYFGAVDLMHSVGAERDVLVGYRWRHNETSRDTSSTDQSVTLGLTGKLVRRVKGDLRIGYQTRTPHGATGEQTTFDSWTASGSATYAVNKRLNISGTVAKDFATSATDAFVDATTFTADLQYAYSSRWTAAWAGNIGDSRFLGRGGRVIRTAGPPVIFGPNRHDQHLNGTAAVNYSLNERFKASLAYAWFKNWSTLAYADFVRSSWTFTASTRW